MAALIFPLSPAVGEVHPSDPGTSGVSQYRWDGTKWNTVRTSVNLGTENQGSFNQYQWPSTDGGAGQQLTTDGLGNLAWEASGNSGFQPLGLLELFDGVQKSFTLVYLGTTTPYTPSTPDNIIVFLGGVTQTPVASYTISGNTITFEEPPLDGSLFYAVSSVNM